MAYHLSPETSPFTRLPISGAYHVAVTSLLVPETKRRSFIGVVCLPSFENEWSLLIEEERSGEFTATLRKADEQIWGCIPDRSPTVSEYGVPFSEEIGRSALTLWSDQLMKVNYDSPPVIGTDGVRYHLFANYNHRRLAGSTWSPNPDSDVGHLVAIAHTLHDYVAAQPSERDEIITHFDSHAAWLAQSPRDRNHSEPLHQLQTSVSKMIQHMNAGIFTPCDVANNISTQLAYSNYPPIGPLLEMLDTLPESVRASLKGDRQKA